MYSFFISLFAFLAAIALLIGVHEYGHFIVARLCGIKVLEFSLGFGPTLWQKQSKKGTRYRLALVPIGGYVKMLDEREGPIPQHLLSQVFNRQPLWKRVAVILAGPFFNLLLAFGLYWLIFMIGFTQLTPKLGLITPHSIAANAQLKSGLVLTKIADDKVYSWPDVQTTLLGHIGQSQPVPVSTNDGKTYYLQLKDWQLIGREPDILDSLGIAPYIPQLPAVIGQITADGPAARAGLQAQDVIVAIDHKPIAQFQALYDYVQQHPDQSVSLTVLRNHQQQQVTVQLGSVLQGDKRVGQLGVMSAMMAWPSDMLTTVRYLPWQAIVPAWHKVIAMSDISIKLIGKMITGNISWQGMSGPVGIAQGAGISASLGVVPFLSFLALISISLGILNLLPIPMLDGGQLLFCLIEAICKRPLPERIQLISLQISIIFLFGVMTLALYNDIMRIHH